MIQISAVPAVALPITCDPKSDVGAELTNSGHFAALLGAQPGVAAQELPAGPLEVSGQAAAKLQLPNGKHGGKLLPLSALPVAAIATDVVTGLTQKQKAGSVSTLVASLDKQEADPLQPQVVPNPFAATALPMPTISVQPAAAPALAIQFDRPIAKTIAGVANPEPKPTLAAAPVQQAPSAQTPAATVSPSIVFLPGGAPAPLAKPSVELRLPLPVTAPLATATAKTAQPVDTASALQAVSASPAAAIVQQAAPAQAAAPQQLHQIRSRPGRARIEDRQNPLPAVSPSVSAAASEEPSLVSPVQPITAQPMLAMPQDQAAPATAAAAPMHAGNRVEAPADFSTLVDRLVAAREAAQSTLTPSVVHAAVAHAEFGKVSLRFEQQGGGLNVSMTSADPDFARSVLAVAPASQQGMDMGDGRGSTGQQDTGQSLSQPQTQTQGQSQANGQSASRNPATLQQNGTQQAQATPTSSATSNDEDPPRRRGIFA